MSIDSTSIRVHQSANGGKNSVNKSVGMSRGGRTTIIHAIADGLGNPVEFLLSRGNEHDSTHAIELLSKINISESNILTNKTYGSKSIREYIQSKMLLILFHQDPAIRSNGIVMGGYIRASPC